MESNNHNARTSEAMDSRRARREAAGAQPQTRRSRSSHAKRTTASRRWLGRTGILTSLAIMTIAMPLTAGAGKADTGTVEAVVVESSTQSTLQVITSQRRAESEPIIVADAELLTERSLATVSRAGARDDDLPLCTAGPVSGLNGQLGQQELCNFDWAPGHSQQATAALALTELNSAYESRFGTNLCLTSSYRTLSSQESLAGTKPDFAATPGHSMHGWGLAIDLCPTSYTSTAQWNWLKLNAPIFGYDNPAWARHGGIGAYEPWHWEYYPIVDTM